jgi:hypothetical protein
MIISSDANFLINSSTHCTALSLEYPKRIPGQLAVYSSASRLVLLKMGQELVTYGVILTK